MHYRDLRGWLKGVDSFGELRIVEGADWNQEIGAVAEVAAQSDPSRRYCSIRSKIIRRAGASSPACTIPTLKRQCLTNHLPLDYTRDQFIDAWKKRLDKPELIPPRVVDSGPVLENIFEGKDIDLLSLPAPHWHEGDGGRYLRLARHDDHARFRRRLDQRRLLPRDGARSRYVGALHFARPPRQHSSAKIFRQRASRSPWRSASVPIRYCGSSARWKSLPDNRNTITPAACVGKVTK